MIQIAVFASGNGTNAENIIKYFQGHPKLKIALVTSNNKVSNVLKRAKKHNIPTLIFSSEELNNRAVLKELQKREINFIVLAGFLLKIPSNLIRAYPKKIINIHPSLLPLYGGKGMYGMHVHKAIIENKESVSGITIHYVTSNYDEGPIIFQKEVSIDPSDTAKDLANKIHDLEMHYFPKVVEKILIR